MQEIRIKELIEFRRKSSERSKKIFAFKLKFRKITEKKVTDDSGGGNYWVISTSCIYNVFKNNNNEFYDIKIEELRNKFENAEDKRSKTMYQRNLDILLSFKDFELLELRPMNIQKFETVHKANKIINIADFPLYLNPSLLFSFDKNGKKELGAIWLVPQINGFKRSELGIFCEILYKFLVKNYSDNYQISEDYCIAVDTYNPQKVIYSEMLNGEIPFLVDKTLKDIKES